MDNTLYIHNPCLPGHYTVAAVANERFIQEKIAAFTDIAASLGAKRIGLLSASVREKGGGGKESLEAVAIQAGLNVEFTDENSVQRGVMMEFDVPEHEPYVPEQLEPWLIIDPVLRTFVNSRLRQNLRKSKITLKLNEAFGFAADLSAKFKGVGARVGGEYRDVAESNWTFEVDFFSKSELANRS